MLKRVTMAVRGGARGGQGGHFALPQGMLQHAGGAHQREFFARDMDRPGIRPFLHVYPTSQLNGWAYLTDGICPAVCRGGMATSAR